MFLWIKTFNGCLLTQDSSFNIISLYKTVEEPRKVNHRHIHFYRIGCKLIIRDFKPSEIKQFVYLFILWLFIVYLAI